MGIWRIKDYQTDVLLVCAADGVGSEKLSHHGAAEACRIMRDLVTPYVPALLRADGDGAADLWAVIADRLADRLIAVAQQMRASPQKLFTYPAAAVIQTSSASVVERRDVRTQRGDATRAAA